MFVLTFDINWYTLTQLTTFHAEPVMSEEDKKKKALASALFGGVTMATKTGPLSVS